MESLVSLKTTPCASLHASLPSSLSTRKLSVVKTIYSIKRLKRKPITLISKLHKLFCCIMNGIDGVGKNLRLRCWKELSTAQDSASRVAVPLPEEMGPGRRKRKRAAILMSPWTNPCAQRRQRTGPPHRQYDPSEPLDSTLTATFDAFMTADSGDKRDVGVPHCYPGKEWFRQILTNFTRLSNTHIDAYLVVLRKRQRDIIRPHLRQTLIIDTEFYTRLHGRWMKLVKGSADAVVAPKGWRVGFDWGDLTVWPRGEAVRETEHWAMASEFYIPCNVGKQHWLLAIVDLQKWNIEVYDSNSMVVPLRPRKAQLGCLRYLLEDLLYTTDYWSARPEVTNNKYPFTLNIRHANIAPQQQFEGNCRVFMLRMIEYLMLNKEYFDHNEDTAAELRHRIAVEIFGNSTDSDSGSEHDVDVA